MAKPNYAFAKRQKELAKKQKKEEKKLLKSQNQTEGEPGIEDGESDESPDQDLTQTPDPLATAVKGSTDAA